MADKTPSAIPTDQAILKELKKMNRLITLSYGDKIEQELSRFAGSDERKMIWALMDGKRQSPEIAQIIKKTKSAVDKFLQSLENAGLVEERAYGKPPVRAVDYVPASWVELLPKSEAVEEKPSETDNVGQTPSQAEVVKVG